jgi:hypothetical protein
MAICASLVSLRCLKAWMPAPREPPFSVQALAPPRGQDYSGPNSSWRRSLASRHPFHKNSVLPDVFFGMRSKHGASPPALSQYTTNSALRVTTATLNIVDETENEFLAMAHEKRTGKVTKIAKLKGECIIPPELPKEELHKLLFRHSEQEAEEIKNYVEWQAHGEEKVLHVEKVASERIFGREHDVWDVHTDKERWWVITGPTNLYSQTLMPSLDYTLSFHIGLMARLAAQRKPDGSEAEQEFLLVTNRKMVQASEAFDQADEAEEFQAVGMRCRECLLALVRELTHGSDIADGNDLPKAADFLGWIDRIANAVAPGSSAECVRGYLKTTADRAWRLVQWLTHAANATRNDAELALSATSHVINNYALLVLKRKVSSPERCGRCKSYRITVDWRPDLGPTGLYVPRCEACGAEKLSAAPRRRRPNSHKS